MRRPNKPRQPQLDAKSLKNIESGMPLDFKGSPSDFFMQYLKSIRRELGISLTIDPPYIKDAVDKVLYELGPRAGQNIKAEKITKIDEDTHSDNGKSIHFLMSVSIEARYKSMGADRKFTIPITLTLNPEEDSQEWDYGFHFEEEDLLEEQAANRQDQDAIVAPSKAVADEVDKTIRRPASGGGPGTGKRA